MKNHAILVIAVIFGVVISGCTTVSPGLKQTFSAPQITKDAPTGPTVTVLIKARAFDPAIITIKEGTMVTWINDDTLMHRVVHLPEVTKAELFNSGPLSPGQSFSFRFTEKGRYEYGDPQIGGSSPPLVIVE
jgi:plastocyanin